MKSIRNKIYLQNGILIITIVIILESIFIMGIRNHYIKSVEQELLNKANISGDFYNNYLLDNNINEKARYILENDSKDQYIYMQVFDINGFMITDSNGFKSLEPFDDIELALKDNSKVITSKDSVSNEKIMSIYVPLHEQYKISGILRYTISIEEIEEILFKIYLVSIFVGILVIISAFTFSSFLAKGIVSPIKNLTKAAESMANGDFLKRAAKKDDDEIGKLSDTLNYMADEIVKSNALKNEFISSVSHEIRTPLTAIKGWSEILLSGEIESEEETKEGIKIISNETERLMGLVEELLDFSKFQAGKITLNLEKIDINNILKEICSYFKKRVERENIELKVKLDSKPCIIMGDINRLKQVFINIIDNSIKFSKTNAKIQITTFCSDNSVVIEIEDNGVGIPEEDIHKVTEKFYKGKSKYSGSGIGLAVCKEIISQHGGRFTITSKENKGTKVIIEILTEL